MSIFIVDKRRLKCERVTRPRFPRNWENTYEPQIRFFKEVQTYPVKVFKERQQEQATLGNQSSQTSNDFRDTGLFNCGELIRALNQPLTRGRLDLGERIGLEVVNGKHCHHFSVFCSWFKEYNSTYLYRLTSRTCGTELVRPFDKQIREASFPRLPGAVKIDEVQQWTALSVRTFKIQGHFKNEYTWNSETRPWLWRS